MIHCFYIHSFVQKRICRQNNVFQSLNNAKSERNFPSGLTQSVGELIITWGNVFVVDHDLAISVGTTELVEEAEQVHDELHNVGLGGITVQMDVLDTPKTAGQAVSRSTVNNRG